VCLAADANSVQQICKHGKWPFCKEKYVHMCVSHLLVGVGGTVLAASLLLGLLGLYTYPYYM
jgi:hypothetical protein